MMSTEAMVGGTGIDVEEGEEKYLYARLETKRL